MHLVFNGPSNYLKLFNGGGSILFSADAYNVTVGTVENNDSRFYGHYGACPPGVYTLGTPMVLDPQEVPYGGFYIPLIDVNALWVRYGRDGIGIHGGGSGLGDPFAPRQGWVETEGCFRLQNVDLAILVGHLQGLSSVEFTVFQGAAT